MSASATDTAEPHGHHDTVGRLVYRANSIGRFFHGQGPQEQAAISTADHLKSFWTPRMRQQIFDHLDSTGGKGLEPIALEAVKVLRQAAPGTIRRELERMGEPTGRAPGNDAG